jgi:hypothetical protein
VDRVGITEKVLGLLLVLMAVGVVLGFVFQVATDREYLFDVAENDYVVTAAGRSNRAGETLGDAAIAAENPFPDPDLEDWQAPRHADRFAADELYVKIDGRAEAYLRFHVVGLTFGTYVYRRDAGRTIDVYWYDMGTPENAQAMYASEEPPDAAPAPVGRKGYQAGGAVFFCQGSSYVQILPSRLDEADARVALAIAERLAHRTDP